MGEFETKLGAIRALLETWRIDALLLQRASSLAWATCGARMQVNQGSSYGAAALLVTRSDHHLITDNLEAARLQEEEHLAEQGWRFHVRAWHEPDRALGQLTRGQRLGADSEYRGAIDLSAAIARLRSRLTPEEQERMRLLGAACAQALTRAAIDARAGDTEQEISARLAYQAERLGVQPVVNLVAADDRILRYRHAVPTGRRIDRYLMLVLSGRRQGLVCSVTRFVHFGPLPDDLCRAHETVARIAARCIAATRPGVPLGEVLGLAMAEYAAAGVPQAWHDHHQGGAAGYEAREFLITPGMAECPTAGQAFVWNPSLGAARSVDTFLIGEARNEVVTTDTAWPTWPVEAPGGVTRRPAVLEV